MIHESDATTFILGSAMVFRRGVDIAGAYTQGTTISILAQALGETSLRLLPWILGTATADTAGIATKYIVWYLSNGYLSIHFP